MVGYPYTKYLMSVMDVDMGAALLLASHGCAERLGVPPERRVYLRGWCSAMDPIYVAEHDPLWSSPAMGAAAGEALAVAGVGIDDVAQPNGSVVFQVFVDNVKVYDSATVTWSNGPKSVSVNVAGKSTLRLVVTDAGDGTAWDQADWAGARLLK